MFDQTTRTILPVSKESKIFSGHFVYLFKVPTLRLEKDKNASYFQMMRFEIDEVAKASSTTGKEKSKFNLIS